METTLADDGNYSCYRTSEDKLQVDDNSLPSAQASQRIIWQKYVKQMACLVTFLSHKER